MTPREVAKWLTIGRTKFAKQQAAEHAAAETNARAKLARQAKAARAASVRGSAEPPRLSAKQVANFLWGPQIKASLRPAGYAFSWVVQTLAQGLIAAGLLPLDHPARTSVGAASFRLGQVLEEARLNLPPFQTLWTALRLKTPDAALVATRQYSMFAAIVGTLLLAVLLTLNFLLRILLGVAHAQAPGATSTSGLSVGSFTFTGDIASGLLNGIFGTGTGSQSVVSSGLGGMLAFYSNMMLVFAGLIVLWIIISAVAETARTGVPFGKQFNHIWAPIRLIVALGLLIPLSSGLNSGQYLILSLVQWGSSEATQLSTQFAQAVIGTNGSSSGLMSVPLNVSNNRQFADQIFQPVLCQQIYNQYLQNSQQITCTGMAGAADDPNCVDENTVGKITVGSTTANVSASGVTPPTPPANQPAEITWANNTSGGQINCGSTTVYLPSGTSTTGNNVQAADLATQAELIAQSNVSANLVQNITPVAAQLASASLTEGGSVPYDKPAGYNQYQAVFNQYMSAKTTALTSTINTYNGAVLNGMVQDMQQYGWIYGPVWIANIASQNGQILDTAQVVPKVASPPQNPFPGNSTASNAWNTATNVVASWQPPGQSANSPLALQKFGTIANLMQQLTSTIGNNPLGNAGSYGGMLLSEGFELITPKDQIDCYQNPTASADCYWAIKEVEQLNPNTQITSANVSQYMPAYYQDMHIGAPNSGGATILPDPNVQTQNFQQLQMLVAGNGSLRSIMFPIGMIMISVGFMLKLLTFIVLGRFSLGVLNWLIMVFEAELAVPFISLSFLRTDGEGFMPQQVLTAVVMLLNVILRPILMSIGLYVGLIAFNAIMTVVNILMAPTVQSLVSNGATTDNSYLTLGVCMIFYATLAYTLANSAFKVIDILPNYLMGWLGQRVESRVDDAGMVQQQAQGYMQTMAYSMRGAPDATSGYGRQQAHQQWQQEQQANAATVQQAGFTGGMPQYERALANPSSSMHNQAVQLSESGQLYNTGPDPSKLGGTTNASQTPSVPAPESAAAASSQNGNQPTTNTGGGKPTVGGTA